MDGDRHLFLNYSAAEEAQVVQHSFPMLFNVTIEEVMVLKLNGNAKQKCQWNISLAKCKFLVKDMIIQMILTFLLAPVAWNILLIEQELIRINQNQTKEAILIQAMDGTMENHIKMKIVQALVCLFSFASLDLSFSKH
jgi:hypothetical protein